MEDNRGIIVDIEGFDGSGKETQAILLEKALGRVCVDLERVAFPRYSTRSGSIVRDYLIGGFRKSEGISNFDYSVQVSMLYAFDRMQALFVKEEGTKSLYERIMDGTSVIFDRYTYSNIFHQATHLLGIDDDELSEIILDFFNKIASIEFNQCRLPQPDITIFLQVSPSVAVENIMKRNDGKEHKDILENHDHLTKVNMVKELFDEFYTPDHTFVTIKCDDNGKMRDPHEIHLEIMEHVSKVL